MTFITHSVRAAWSLLMMTGLTCTMTNMARAEDDPLKNMRRVDVTEFYRAAVTKSLPLLQTSAAEFREQSGGSCFSCHHQSLPTMAVATARQHGFAVDTKKALEETYFVHDLFGKMQPLLEKAQTDRAAEKVADLILVDPSISIAYALSGLQAEGQKPDRTTEAMTRYLMRKQLSDGRWPVLTARPPLESSEFTTTAMAVNILQRYAPKNMTADMNERIGRARTWLRATQPRTTEDKVFRLFGLRWSGAGTTEIKAAANDLLALQHDDGGWGQLPNTASDAYATGQALVALYQAGGLPVTDSAYTRGAFFLAVTQKEDGSWLVAKRANPVQPPMDTKFPHDKDQFISCSGTSWATMALALAIPVTSPPADKVSLAK